VCYDKYFNVLYLCGDKGLDLEISTHDIMGKEADVTSEAYVSDIISCLAK
jgi:hypothetical protein